VPVGCRVILSSHNFQETPAAPQLQRLAADMLAAGADIVKIATMANDVTDAATVLSLLDKPAGESALVTFHPRYGVHQGGQDPVLLHSHRPCAVCLPHNTAHLQCGT
jgi:hypothetical protein